MSAFPSPASTTGSLDSPTLKFALNRTRSYLSQLTPQDGLSDADKVLPAEPDASKPEPLMTPLSEDRVESPMDMIVGGALAPVHSPPLPLSPPQRRSQLRLPSFEALGIAAPHPDRFGVVEFEPTPGCDTMRLPGTPQAEHDISQSLDGADVGQTTADDPSDLPPSKGAGRAMQLPIHHYVNTITPPADGSKLDWGSLAKVQTGAMDSPSTDPGNAAPQSDSSVAGATDTAQSSSQPTQLVERVAVGDEESGPWYEGPIDVLLENLRSSPLSIDSLKILSHALPSPSNSGHIFSKVITAVHGYSTPTSPTSASSMTWINVFHAIPGRFNLADIPTSPPSTPGPAVGGEDYFTQKVFDSAVSISDYQEDMSLLPRSPRPVVAPHSIDVSIVERYIPPSTSNEFTNMFDPNGPSILVDRLIELSPNNGTLLFIYPTRKGAQTFMRDYLGPILDPLLRTMVVVHGLSSDLSRTLGSMISVDQLFDYETLQRRMAALCTKLTHRRTIAGRFYERQPRFSLTHASKQYVKLDRDAWARDWWTKQEKPRIRDTLTRFTQDVQKMTSSGYSERAVTPTELVQQLLDGVIRKPYQHGQDPESGVEVSVFVINRTG